MHACLNRPMHLLLPQEAHVPRSSPNKLVAVQSLYYEMYEKTFSKKKVYETIKWNVWPLKEMLGC